MSEINYVRNLHLQICVYIFHKKVTAFLRKVPTEKEGCTMEILITLYFEGWWLLFHAELLSGCAVFTPTLMNPPHFLIITL